MRSSVKIQSNEGQPAARPRRWNGRRLGAAGGAVLVLGVVVVWVLTMGGMEPAGDPATPAEPNVAADPVALAEAYLEARNAYDSERARELVSNDFRTTEAPDGFRDVETMELAFALHEAFGFHYSEVDCSLVSEAPEQVVACDYRWTTELQRITGYPPVPVSGTFVVRDDLIGGIDEDRNLSEFTPNVYNPWLEYLSSEHPEFRELVLASHGLDPERTPETIELMPRYLELYKEWVNDRDA